MSAALPDRAPPWVKICGVTRVEDALRSVALGADLLGLNFWPGSARCLKVDAARAIVEAVGGRALVAGVFVNQAPERIDRVRAEVGLDLVQLHGDETPEEVNRHGGRAIKAVRLDPRRPELDPDLFPEAWGFLIEARRPGEYGGSGAAWEYGAIARLVADRPVLVAGGIRPQTARDALQRSRAWGVDVCSGVESAPGVKDSGRLEALFAEVRGSASAGGGAANRS